MRPTKYLLSLSSAGESLMRPMAALLAFAALLTMGYAKPKRKIHFDGQSWWNHVLVLADDSMEGRDTGSMGLRKAEAYTVERLKEYGLQPAGTHGFYQPIQFLKTQIDEKNSYADLVNAGKQEPLVLGQDAFFSTKVDLPAQEVAAPLVFVGYGLQIPERNYDDYAGLDLKGKVAVYLSGSPEALPNELAAHSQTMAERGKALRAAGAIGVIRILNPASLDIPWSRISLNRTRPAMRLADPSLQDSAGLKVALVFNPAYAEKLFAGSGHSFAELAALASDRQPLPRFPLAVSLKAHAAIQETQVQSSNIVAKFPGTDPKLKDQYVVLSAHIDHLGIGAPINGDRIYNGAIDNGSGCALLIDMADSLLHGDETRAGQPRAERLRRSVLFVFFTAEEKGLLGSRYFTVHPTVDPHSIVADINVDMFLPIIPLKVLRIQGLEESTLGKDAADIARSLGVKPVPDPEPLRNLFIRSDQYNFILHGIPSVIMDVFAEPGTPDAQVLKDWLTNRYHAPSDDAKQPIDFHAAALYEEIVRRLIVETAIDGSRPAWFRDSFFRRYSEGR
jgi:Zn-dependent M28 family amino/carboxypeptidase